mgnify:CR=1 FL=1
MGVVLPHEGHISPFINTVCDILNGNFVEETLQDNGEDDKDEIPF